MQRGEPHSFAFSVGEPDAPDFLSENSGTIVTLWPMSAAACKRIGDDALHFEHRFFLDAALDLIANGYSIEDRTTGRRAQLSEGW